MMASLFIAHQTFITSTFHRSFQPQALLLIHPLQLPSGRPIIQSALLYSAGQGLNEEYIFFTSCPLTS